MFGLVLVIEPRPWACWEVLCQFPGLPCSLCWEMGSYLETRSFNSSCVLALCDRLPRESPDKSHNGPPTVFSFQLRGSVVSALCLQAALTPSITLSPLYSPVPGGDPSGKAGVRQLPGTLPKPPCVGQCCNRVLPKVTGPRPCGPPAGHCREKGTQVLPLVGTFPKSFH